MLIKCSKPLRFLVQNSAWIFGSSQSFYVVVDRYEIIVNEVKIIF